MSIDLEPVSRYGVDWNDTPSWPGRPDWHENAACRGADPVLFFGPDAGFEKDADKARRESARDALCACCPVWRECAAVGEQEHYGHWGGGPAGRRSKRWGR